MRLTRALALTAFGSAGAGGLYLGLVTGAVTVDLGLGRRTRPLGPIEVIIHAPRQLVYDAAASPYDVRQTRAMREKVLQMERGDGMVLAAHRTPVGTVFGRRLTATTTETVTLDPPGRIGFRLLRGPVPHVRETFELTELDPDTTLLRYDGELGTDLWGLGETWGSLVARTWEQTVRASLDEIKTAAETHGN